MKYPKVWPLCLNFTYITAEFSGVQKFGNFTVLIMTYVCSVYEESLKCLISAAEGALDDCSATDLAPVVKGSVRMFRDVMAKMIPLPAEVLPLFKIIDFSVCDGMLLLHLLIRASL